jgi:hypothetical protein
MKRTLRAVHGSAARTLVPAAVLCCLAVTTPRTAFAQVGADSQQLPPAAPLAPAADTAPPPAPLLPAVSPGTEGPVVLAPVAPVAPLSGWHDGVFYLRDASDDFRLYVQGRVHVDFVSYFGAGLGNLPPDAALKSGFTLRRVRTELSGELFKRWQWQLSGEFGPTSVDNAGARTATRDCSIDPTTGAQTCSDRVSGVEAAGVRPIPTDAFVSFVADRLLNIQVGQYLLPFTFEARISDNTTPFLERSLPVRTVGAPNTRDIGAMAWGETKNRVFYYSVGVFDGDGPNRPNEDNRSDVVGRAVVRPLAASRGPLQALQIGLSGKAGSRDPHRVGYDAPALTTQGGYAFWKPTYRDATNRLVHIIPSGDQLGAAADLFLPFDRFDLTAEVIYSASNTRETYDGQQLSPFTPRLGDLSGYAYYVQAGAWILGDRTMIGFPSTAKPAHIDLDKPSSVVPSHALQALVKFEQLRLDYAGSSRGGVNDAKTPDGAIEVESFSVGLNYWATKHVRVTADYVTYLFPSSEPASPSTEGGPVQTSLNRAQAPAQSLVAGPNDAARDRAHTLHEISMRVGVQF